MTGDPALLAQVREVLTWRHLHAAACEVYRYHSAGGALHIATDDGNLSDNDLCFCLQEALKREPGPQRDAEVWCAKVWLLGSPTQRRKAYAVGNYEAALRGER